MINIGILVNNCMIRSWEYSAIYQLRETDCARISLIIKYKGNSTKLNRKAACPLPFLLHKHIDSLIFHGNRNNSGRKEIRELLKDVPIVELSSSEDQTHEYHNIDDVDPISRYNLDVIIKLGYGFIRGKILKVPVYGVWSYSINHYLSEEADTAGYHEVIRKNPVTVSEIGVVNESGETYKVLNRVVDTTCSYSVSLTRNIIFARSPFLMPVVLERIHVLGDQYYNQLTQRADSEKYLIREQNIVPSFKRSLFNIFSAKFILFRKIIKKLFFTDAFSWVLLFKIDPVNDFLQNRYESFNSLKPSGDKFWADPFVISRDGKYYLFVEEFIYSKNKGHISVLELDSKGTLLQVQKVIEKPYHMSYPFVFETDNVYYMIPETGSNQTIDLYKCTEFPGKWTFVKSLMKNLNAVDSTLFHYNNKWWLFTVIDKIETKHDSSPELYLFFTDDFLSGNWTSHPMNPIVADVRSARPAGKIFIMDGKIMRPSQDCSGIYGNSFNLNQIKVLTEADYNEERVLKINPSWDRKLKGTHTFNFDGDFTVIDAHSCRRRFF